jgi:putative ABC transport system permease protein
MHDWKNEIREALLQLSLRPLREAEIVEELGQHLEDRYEDLLLQGYTEDEAVQKTLSEFRQNEMVRDLRGLERTYLEPVELGQEPRSSQTAGLWQDLRYAFRVLLSQFGVTLVVIITMGLGIGVNTTIFSTLQLLAFRPFDFPNQDRLVTVFERQRDTGINRGSVAPGNFADWREQNQTFEDLVAIRSGYFDLANASQPERLPGHFVSAGFFNTLGTLPALGRTFSAEDTEPGRHQVVVLSNGLWRTRFGADPQIVGRSVKLNEDTYTVVGVMPKDFHYPVDDGQLWVPLVSDPTDRSRRDHNLSVVGLPRSGVSLTQATEDLNRIAVSLQSEYPETNQGREVRVVSLVKDATRGVRVAVPFMFVSVLLVLLVACANVANILLVRAAARQRDIAIRLALGASRGRVMRQLFAHSLLLSGFGGCLGLLLAYLGIKAVRAMPQDFSMFIPGWSKMGIDQTALVFTLGVSVLTGILCGLIPALIGTRVELNQLLKDDGPSVLGKSSSRATRWLVISEVAFSVILLAGAGTLFRSFQRLLHADFGIEATNVLTMQLSLSGERYQAAQSRHNFANALIGKVSALHGISEVGLASTVPLGYSYNRREIAGIGSTVFADGHRLSVTFRTITPRYLEAIGTPLREGRAFTEQDREGTPGVALVNEAFSKQFMAGRQVIGESLVLNNGQRYEVVGVLANVINDDLDERADAEVYVPYAQEPVRDMFLVTRSDYTSDALVQAIRGEVSAVDPSVPVFKVKPLQQYVDERLSAKKMAAYSLAVGALIALVLAAVGIYSVVAYSVTQRTHEIGLRIALGASSGDILKLVLGTGLRLVLIGGAIGLAGALVLTQLLSGLLVGVSARDPLTLAGIISILAAVALLACYLPARRAMKLDPLDALRYQ